jgi:5-methylcytosine-specific restriction protein A
MYEPKRHLLIEAKGSASREDVRMAIGQLYDYDLLTHEAGKGKSDLALLLPERPSADVERLLDSLKIGLIWRDGRKFADRPRGKFV